MYRSLRAIFFICVLSIAGLNATQEPLVHFRSSDKKSHYYSKRDIFDSPILYAKDLEATYLADARLRTINANITGLRAYNKAIDILRCPDFEKALQEHIDALSDNQCRLLTNVAGRLENPYLLIALSYRWLGKHVVDEHITPYVMEPVIQKFKQSIIAKNLLEYKYATIDYYGVVSPLIKSINIVSLNDLTWPTVAVGKEGNFFCEPGENSCIIKLFDPKKTIKVCSLHSLPLISRINALGVSADGRNIFVSMGANVSNDYMRRFELYNDAQEHVLESLKKAPVTLFQARKLYRLVKAYDANVITPERACQACKECIMPVLSDKKLSLDLCFP